MRLITIFYFIFLALFVFVACKSDKCVDSLESLISKWNSDNIRTSEHYEIDRKNDTTNIFIYEVSKFGSSELQDLTITDLYLNICELEKTCLNHSVFLHYILPSSQFENSKVKVKKSKEIRGEDCGVLVSSISQEKKKLLNYIVKNFRTDDEQEISDAARVVSRLYSVGDSTMSGLKVFFNYLNFKNASDVQNSKAYWNVLALNKIIKESGVASQIHIDSINAILGIPALEINWDELDHKMKLHSR